MDQSWTIANISVLKIALVANIRTWPQNVLPSKLADDLHWDAKKSEHVLFVRFKNILACLWWYTIFWPCSDATLYHIDLTWCDNDTVCSRCSIKPSVSRTCTHTIFIKLEICTWFNWFKTHWVESKIEKNEVFLSNNEVI